MQFVMENEAKQELRKRMLSMRASIPEDVRLEQSEKIAFYILNSKEYNECKVILLYISIRDEISTASLIKAALQDNKTVCLPACLPEKRMEARVYQKESDFTEMYNGIPQPGKHCTVISPDMLELCIVPALCCDTQGYRLGYGGGYYDRYLPKATRAKKITICAKQRIFQTIPHGDFDVPCDKIITEAGQVYEK